MLKKINDILVLADNRAEENRAKFFERIERIYSPLDWRYALIEKAYDIAKDAFREKFRDGGGRYFEHLRAVSLIIIDYLRITDHEIIIAALLHDIVEDIPSWTIERIRNIFGDNVALWVSYLTKSPKSKIPDKLEREDAYMKLLESAPREVFLIKLVDFLHNCLTMWKCTPQKRHDKIRQSKVYLRHAVREIILIHEIEEAVEVLKKGCPIEVSMN